MDKLRFNAIKRVAIVGALTNALLAVVKILVGTLGRSPAVFADGIHSLSDLIGDLIVYIAGYFSQHGPDDGHPYGHHRAETFATLILGVLLIVVAIGIGWDGFAQLWGKTYQVPDHYTIYAAIFSIILNEGLFRYTLNVGKKINSDMLKANAYHSRGDSLSSVIVLIGLIGAFLGWTFLDVVAAIIVALFILKMGVHYAWHAIEEFTEAGVSIELQQKIEELIWAQPGVKQMHQLRTRRLGGKIFLDVHVLIDPYSSASEGHFIAELVRVALMKTFSNIEDVTVHVDTEDHPEGLPDKLLPTRTELLDALMPAWEKIVPKSAVKRLTLYYLHQKIEMIVTLDHSKIPTKTKLNALQSAFDESIKTHGIIHKITVQFAL